MHGTQRRRSDKAARGLTTVENVQRSKRLPVSYCVARKPRDSIRSRLPAGSMAGTLPSWWSSECALLTTPMQIAPALPQQQSTPAARTSNDANSWPLLRSLSSRLFGKDQTKATPAANCTARGTLPQWWPYAICLSTPSTVDAMRGSSSASEPAPNESSTLPAEALGQGSLPAWWSRKQLALVTVSHEAHASPSQRPTAPTACSGGCCIVS